LPENKAEPLANADQPPKPKDDFPKTDLATGEMETDKSRLLLDAFEALEEGLCLLGAPPLDQQSDRIG